MSERLGPANHLSLEELLNALKETLFRGFLRQTKVKGHIHRHIYGV